MFRILSEVVLNSKMFNKFTTSTSRYHCSPNSNRKKELILHRAATKNDRSIQWKIKTRDASNAITYESVSDAYAGKSIFVTGGTGFLGKVFIEKILYSCPKISKIYILTREQPNSDVEEKVKNMIQMPVFDRLRKERPQDLNKIIPVAGDIELPKLGLKPKEEKMLVNEVSMVFHIAATVKFNEPLQQALKTNFIGTKYVLQLCQRIRNIEAFTYMSTAYSNPKVDFIEEVLYPPLISLEEAEQLANRSDIPDQETSKILGNSFNTYTFTKGLAENYIAKYHGDIPTVILRPSVVVASKAEPIVGWVDNWAGATPLIMPLAQGLNRTLLSDSNYTVDLIPVDYVANITIVSASKVKRSKDVSVYNITTSSENPITVGEFINISTEHIVKNNVDTVPFPMIMLTSSKGLVTLVTYFQKLCASLADFRLFFVGLKPRYAKQQSMILHIRDSAEPFTRRSWTITADKTCALFESLSDTDQQCFDFHPRNIVWVELISAYMDGIQKYLHKNNTSKPL